MTTAVDLVDIREARVDRLNPTARGRKDLAAECGEGDGNRHWRRSLALSTSEKLSELPVPPRSRRAGARQPVQRDVVDDGVTGEMAHGLAVDERLGDLVVAVRVMVQQPGGESDR